MKIKIKKIMNNYPTHKINRHQNKAKIIKIKIKKIIVYSLL